MQPVKQKLSENETDDLQPVQYVKDFVKSLSDDAKVIVNADLGVKAWGIRPSSEKKADAPPFETVELPLSELKSGYEAVIIDTNQNEVLDSKDEGYRLASSSDYTIPLTFEELVSEVF
jgi:hypothetical protein